MLELADMTKSMGISFVDGDAVIETNLDLEQKYIEQLLDAVKEEKFNVIVLDKLESISKDSNRTSEILEKIISYGAIILVKQNHQLIAYQSKTEVA
ncbi:hypothetical protein [Lachnotalea glycerini]|nr:hypothetical protein [Lachnotalea glycerini]